VCVCVCVCVCEPVSLRVCMPCKHCAMLRATHGQAECIDAGGNGGAPHDTHQSQQCDRRPRCCLCGAMYKISRSGRPVTHTNVHAQTHTHTLAYRHTVHTYMHAHAHGTLWCVHWLSDRHAVLLTCTCAWPRACQVHRHRPDGDGRCVCLVRDQDTPQAAAARRDGAGARPLPGAQAALWHVTHNRRCLANQSLCK
jgi:hypothetical protein